MNLLEYYWPEIASLNLFAINLQQSMPQLHVGLDMNLSEPSMGPIYSEVVVVFVGDFLYRRDFSRSKQL